MQNKLFAPWALTGRARTRGERGKERKQEREEEREEGRKR